MGDKIFIADKLTLDEVKAIVQAQGSTALSNLQPNVLSQAQANNLDASVSSRQAQVMSSTQANRLDANISSRQANWGATTTHRNRIDDTITSRAAQTTVNTISTNVGSNANAASATGSVHAKLKDIKSAIVSSGGGGIKSVQRGAVSSSSYADNVTITAVNLSKSFVNMQTARTNAAAARPHDDNQSATVGRLTNSTTLRVYKSRDHPVSPVDWEVIEFE